MLVIKQMFIQSSCEVFGRNDWAAATLLPWLVWLRDGIHNRWHIYPQYGIFYFPWHRHQEEGTFSVSSKRQGQSGKRHCPSLEMAAGGLEHWYPRLAVRHCNCWATMPHLSTFVRIRLSYLQWPTSKFMIVLHVYIFVDVLARRQRF